jgi:cytidine deaminase
MTTPSDDDLDALFDAAYAIRDRAYAPYSRFKVGAAIRTPDGRVFAGCNVENAAYPVGTCAEAGAIAAMLAGGASRIAAIAVVGTGDELCSPCGGCRQRIREFADGATLIAMVGGEGGERTILTMAEILPLAFGPENLPG